MVTFEMLRSVDTRSWMQVSIDAETLASELEDAAHHIYERGTAPVQNDWEGPLGDKVGRSLKAQADAYLSTSALARTTSGLISTMAKSIVSLRDSLLDYDESARANGLRILPGGKLLPTSAGSQEVERKLMPDLQNLVNEAIESATAIDEEARDRFAELIGAIGRSAVDVKNDYSIDASNAEVMILRESLPIGVTPTEVAIWWGGLNARERRDLERGVPVDLYDLAGIPSDVHNRLRGSSGYNAVETVRFAQDNWNFKDAVSEHIDNKCASFVSASLQAGGLPFKGWNSRDDDSWGHSTWNDHANPGWSHTRSWTEAEGQKDFFLRTGGQQISNLASVRPGDVVYWVQEGDTTGTNLTVGRAHHAAVVTAVTPSGDILYTQMSDPIANASLNTRLPSHEVGEGDQNIVIVRPEKTW